MSLRTRLMMVFAFASTLLVLTLIGIVATWRTTENDRFDRLVLDTQQIAWRKFQAVVFERLDGAASVLAANPDLARALSAKDVAAIRKASSVLSKDARVDVFDREGALLYTSSLAFSQELQLDVGGVQRVLGGDEHLSGVADTTSDEFSFVAASPIRMKDQVIGGVVVGQPVKSVLDELSDGLARPVVLADLRGHAVVGNGTALFNRLQPEIALRRAEIRNQGYPDGYYRFAATPVAGPDGQLVASLITMQETSMERAGELRWMLGIVGVAVVTIAAILSALFIHLRRAFEPLSGAVNVLTALSRGDTSVRLDAQHRDETGQIADGIARLREALLNLEVLTEERQRERWRQESIIREELGDLAATLDEEARQEIAADLVSVLAEEGAATDDSNQLSTVAFVLGRLSERILDQQGRLHELIEELREALKTKQAFVALQQELEIARRMQLSVLPRQFPQRSDVSLASFILPAKEVGGDFYDYFPLDGGRIGVVVADVSGKGVPAAFFMAICRTLLKMSARFVDSPAETLARVNSSLVSENEEMMFVTLFYGILDPATGHFIYATGGHNPPVLRAGNELRMLDCRGGMALGIAEQATILEGELDLAPGNVLFLYTDGITEAQNVDGALFGDAALLDTLASIDPDAPADAYPAEVVKAVQQYMTGAPQADDITCVTLRYAGSIK
ncbi:PP2C family protein-serine/threonine phosphatase [Peristeroidobacter soli]|uniref:PP2C family protein-serine/threonine phosphatase n=1 Tax=Peristeroidobacter soli TaxID=2497877 RepID=UPI00101C7ED8|nr:PP2C family protein-serine/threonine phosphatase [Peristeroidobacter soli]